MHLERYQDPAAFQQQVLPFLVEHEAQNCVSLGVLSRVIESLQRQPNERSPLMALLRAENGQVAAAATRTGTYPLALSLCVAEAAAAFADRLIDAGDSLCGVIGEVSAAEAFASAWARRKPYARRLGDRLGVYQLERLIVPRPTAGTFRQAGTDDFAVLLPFAKEFYREIGEGMTDPTEALWRAIGEHRLFVWCHEGQLVSMAAWAGRTPNGARVNFVYTPPDQRGRGFASNCVAAVTRLLLESGRKRVFLFTDMANPTSNRIYQAIGYVHVGHQQGIFFDPPAPR